MKISFVRSKLIVNDIYRLHPYTHTRVFIQLKLSEEKKQIVHLSEVIFDQSIKPFSCNRLYFGMSDFDRTVRST